MAIQLARYKGADPILTTAGSDRSVDYLTQELGVLPECILRYKDKSFEQLKNQVLKMNGGKPVRAAFDFVGGDMKRLCCNVIGYNGRVVSIVEEPDDFTLNLLTLTFGEGRESSFFAKSATFYCELLSTHAMFGEPETWQIYQRQLNALTELFEAGHIKPPAITDMGSLSAESLRRAHTMLEVGRGKGKLVVSVG